MANIRDERELVWSAWFAESFAEQYDELLERLDPEQPQVPPNEWWDNWQTIFLGFAALQLAATAQASAQEAMLAGVGVNWDAVLGASTEWAQRYGFDLVRGINANSAEAIQRALQGFYSGNLSYDDMTGQLAAWFGPMRAEMIAITETTRGLEQGLQIYQQQLNAQGISTDTRYNAEPGACPICAPDNRRRLSAGWSGGYPPRHPRCRCYTEIVVLAS